MPKKLRNASQAASVRSSGLLLTARRPSPISAQTLAVEDDGGFATSGDLMLNRQSAEHAKEMASSRMTVGGAITWTSAPVSPGVVISATASRVARRLLASRTPSRPTNSGTNER